MSEADYPDDLPPLIPPDPESPTESNGLAVGTSYSGSIPAASLQGYVGATPAAVGLQGYTGLMHPYTDPYGMAYASPLSSLASYHPQAYQQQWFPYPAVGMSPMAAFPAANLPQAANLPPPQNNSLATQPANKWSSVSVQAWLKSWCKAYGFTEEDCDGYAKVIESEQIDGDFLTDPEAFTDTFLKETLKFKAAGVRRKLLKAVRDVSASSGPAVSSSSVDTPDCSTKSSSDNKELVLSFVKSLPKGAQFKLEPIFEPIKYLSVKLDVSVFPIAHVIEKAATYLIRDYFGPLVKPYSDEACPHPQDWVWPWPEDKKNSNMPKVTPVYRPNHGLAHCLRKAAYLPLVLVALQQSKPVSQAAGFHVGPDLLARLQLVLLFEVAGRSSEIGFHDNNKQYGLARRRSAELLGLYVRNHLSACWTDEQLQQHQQQMLNMFSDSQPLLLALRICHDLDLMRCQSQTEFAKKMNAELRPHVSLEFHNELIAFVDKCLRATGNRALGADPPRSSYDKSDKLFLKCSLRHKFCMEQLLQIPVPRVFLEAVSFPVLRLSSESKITLNSGSVIATTADTQIQTFVPEKNFRAMPETCLNVFCDESTPWPTALRVTVSSVTPAVASEQEQMFSQIFREHFPEISPIKKFTKELQHRDKVLSSRILRREMKATAEGGYAKVFKTFLSHEPLALKISKDQSDDGLERLLKEASMLDRLSHQYIVGFRGVCLDLDGKDLNGQEIGYALALSWIGKSLKEELKEAKNPGKLNWSRAANLLAQAAIGMQYLHSKNILHRDLKADNLLVSLTDGDRCVLADFGLACSQGAPVTDYGGTSAWMAPELFVENKVASQETDIYAFGIVMYEVACGLLGLPAEWLGNTKEKLRSLLLEDKKRPDIKLNLTEVECGDLFEQLMCECWAEDPLGRPSFQVIAARLRQFQKAMPTTFQKTLSYSNATEITKFKEEMQNLPWIVPATLVKNKILWVSFEKTTLKQADWSPTTNDQDEKQLHAHLQHLSSRCGSPGHNFASLLRGEQVRSVGANPSAWILQFASIFWCEIKHMNFYDKVRQLNERFKNQHLQPEWDEKTHWMYGEEEEQTAEQRVWRRSVLALMGSFSNFCLQIPEKFRANLHPNLKVQLMFHGCRADVVPLILRGGFVALSKLDQGFFGKGIYLTHSLEYAIAYAQLADLKSKDVVTILVCAVVFGNPFPVIGCDRVEGQGVANGKYDSHVVAVKQELPGSSNFFTTQPPQNPADAARNGCFSEVVIFDISQILPLASLTLMSR
eukprot:gb/GEZN01000567.1/.p1 GENE.gb/GEZN01000567.1/~~gb/GEZN01000567.1/.p1  ORF type:complete len:1268 (-),score=185.79 gb/GEZN01000567.1/:244-4047(-)